MTLEIMNQTLQQRVMHNEILQEILKQLLTLETEILNTNYWHVPGLGENYFYVIVTKP